MVWISRKNSIFRAAYLNCHRSRPPSPGGSAHAICGNGPDDGGGGTGNVNDVTFYVCNSYIYDHNNNNHCEKVKMTWLCAKQTENSNALKFHYNNIQRSDEDSSTRKYKLCIFKYTLQYGQRSSCRIASPHITSHPDKWRQRMLLYVANMWCDGVELLLKIKAKKLLVSQGPCHALALACGKRNKFSLEFPYDGVGPPGH